MSSEVEGSKMEGKQIRWYAIHTHPKQEDRARLNLNGHMEVFAPKIKERHYHPYTGAPTYLSKPLFPQYIFARFDAPQMLHKVSFTRGVESVVSCKHDPLPVDDEAIKLIQSQVGGNGFVNLNHSHEQELEPGDEVSVKEGALKGLTGIFKRTMSGSERVVILLNAIDYQSHLIVDREQISKVG